MNVLYFRGPRGGLYHINDFGRKVYHSVSFGKKPVRKTKRTDEGLWKTIVARVKRGSRGGRPNQWSARKAQLAVKLYKDKGGGYMYPKSKNNSLVKWTRQKWRTKSGKNSVQNKGASGERYLPDRAIRSLTASEYNRTSKAKKGSKGQYSKQPKKISKKVAKYRK